ncbi:MAG: hypothetical protein H6R19_489 [Proteobacteria bacterium]|nr:hypothetical protein [Pseudomonadota bacterium]
MQSTALRLALGLSVLLHLLGLFGLSSDGRGGQVMSGPLMARLQRPPMPVAHEPDAAVKPIPDVAHQLSTKDVPESGRGRGAVPSGRIYWSAESLDQQPVPVSAPDVNRLGAVVFPAATVHLRLFINAGGWVDEVRVLGGANKDEWAPLCELFLATAFIPARREGQTVAAVQDLEISISELMRVL